MLVYKKNQDDTRNAIKIEGKHTQMERVYLTLYGIGEAGLGWLSQKDSFDDLKTQNLS